MSDTLSHPSPRTVEQRLAQRPQVLARLHALLDQLDHAVEAGADAHAAEAALTTQLRLLGHAWLSQWAQDANARVQAGVRTAHPTAIRHGQPLELAWLTTFGWVKVRERAWRLGRRGSVFRPFQQQAGVSPRGASRSLQRAVVDFGAEESFARAVQRMREHYGIDVACGRVRRLTLSHAAELSARALPPPGLTVPVLITAMDGSMIPTVTPPDEGADRRQGKHVQWREARLCLARAKDSATPCYGATLGSAGVAGALWREVAVAAGFGPQTQVQGRGDAAAWIIQQFKLQFGEQGTYLVDFWHTSEYLGAAASVLQPTDAAAWRRAQQGRLLENQVDAILETLAPHREPATQQEAPVRAAHRYLNEHRAHLDYAGARAAGLPIGSGEIESGHRHVIQHRLKLAGCWWKENHAEAMLGLRVARANHRWEAYWSSTSPALN